MKVEKKCLFDDTIQRDRINLLSIILNGGCKVEFSKKHKRFITWCTGQDACPLVKMKRKGKSLTRIYDKSCMEFQDTLTEEDVSMLESIGFECGFPYGEE